MPNVFSPTLEALYQEIINNKERMATQNIPEFLQIMTELRTLAQENSSNPQELYIKCLEILNKVFTCCPGLARFTAKEFIISELDTRLDRARPPRTPWSPGLHEARAPQLPRAFIIAILLPLIDQFFQNQRHQMMGRPRQRPAQAHAAAAVPSSTPAIAMTQILGAQGVDTTELDSLRSIIGQNLIQGEVVVIQDGENRHYYAKDELITWLRQNPINPVNRQPLQIKDLVDATAEYRAKIKAVIMQALAHKPETERQQIVSQLFQEFGWGSSASNGAAAAAAPRPR